MGAWEWFVEWSEEIGGWVARYVMPLNWHNRMYAGGLLDEHKRLVWMVWEHHEEAIQAVIAQIEKDKKGRRERGCVEV